MIRVYVLEGEVVHVGSFDRTKMGDFKVIRKEINRIKSEFGVNTFALDFETDPETKLMGVLKTWPIFNYGMGVFKYINFNWEVWKQTFF
jgi:hypothetical protein